MKKIFGIATVLCLVLLIFCGCNSGVNALEKAQTASNESALSLVCQAVVSDGGVVVYKYSKESAISENQIAVTTTEGKLNSSFVMDEKTATEEFALDRSLFAVLPFSGKTITDVEKSDGKITGKISKDNLSQFLGAEVDAASDASLSAEISEDRLDVLEIAFDTASGKSVVLTYTYRF